MPPKPLSKTMPKIKVCIDYRDGHFSMMPLEMSANPQCNEFIEIDRDMYSSYLLFLEQSAFWHNYIRRLDNEIYENVSSKEP